jgi:hypothetical protein
VALKTLLTFINTLLTKIDHAVRTVIVGDFNVDTRNQREMQRLCRHLPGYTQLVKVPTTDRGSSIDLVFDNYTGQAAMVSVHDCFYSDHDVQMAVLHTD